MALHLNQLCLGFLRLPKGALLRLAPGGHTCELGPLALELLLQLLFAVLQFSNLGLCLHQLFRPGFQRGLFNEQRPDLCFHPCVFRLELLAHLCLGFGAFGQLLFQCTTLIGEFRCLRLGRPGSGLRCIMQPDGFGEPGEHLFSLARLGLEQFLRCLLSALPFLRPEQAGFPFLLWASLQRPHLRCAFLCLFECPLFCAQRDNSSLYRGGFVDILVQLPLQLLCHRAKLGCARRRFLQGLLLCFQRQGHAIQFSGLFLDLLSQLLCRALQLGFSFSAGFQICLRRGMLFCQTGQLLLRAPIVGQCFLQLLVDPGQLRNSVRVRCSSRLFFSALAFDCAFRLAGCPGQGLVSRRRRARLRTRTLAIGCGRVQYCGEFAGFRWNRRGRNCVVGVEFNSRFSHHSQRRS